MKKPKFNVELVPKTCFFTNVRSQVSSNDWDWLRRQTYKQAGNKCEGCNATGRMEAHEIWSYDDKNHIQKLIGLSCYCNLCHLAHHLGFAEIQGKSKIVKEHLAKINEWSMIDTEKYIQSVFKIWQNRSNYKWTLDLKFLDDCEISYSLINPIERAKINN